MRIDVAIPAVDQNGLPFDVWLVGPAPALRDKEGNLYSRHEASDDEGGLGFVDVADSQDVILVPRADYQAALDAPRRTRTLLIVLEIEGDVDNAPQVLGALLDAGVPQDIINDHENEECGPLHVVEGFVREDA